MTPQRASRSVCQPGVGGGDDEADRLLVEAFVTLATLEVFQVAT